MTNVKKQWRERRFLMFLDNPDHFSTHSIEWRTFLYQTRDQELLEYATANAKCVEVRKAIATNPNIAQSIVSKMATDNSATIRMLIASRNDVTVDILEALSSDENDFVRGAVARNPRCCEEKTQLRLSGDLRTVVRCGLAQNPSISQKVQEALSDDSQPAVKAELSNNKNLSERVLKKLVKSNIVAVLLGVASNPAATADVLRKITMKDMDYRVRVAVAKHPNVTEDILFDLIAMGNAIVTMVIATTPTTPINILRHLSLKECDLINVAATNNLKRRES